MRKLESKEDAFTGLEAAIVLIAFVVVAAVFSYVVLGAGFFTTQKAQEVVHSGVSQAASNIIVKGEVYGIADASNSSIGILQFDVGLAAGGMPIDIEKTTLVWSTQLDAPYQMEYSATATPKEGSGTWNVTYKSPSSNSNPLLESNEIFTVQVYPKVNVTPRAQFNLEIKPEIGASLGIQRTLPAGLTPTTMLY